eukprot:14232091-Ditylum_brightwellii.AAC.2
MACNQGLLLRPTVSRSMNGMSRSLTRVCSADVYGIGSSLAASSPSYYVEAILKAWSVAFSVCLATKSAQLGGISDD